MPFKHVCHQCGIEFIASVSVRKYCSRQCNGLGQRHKPIICRHCGKIVVSPDSTRQFCDRKCHAASMRLEQRICEQCGAVYTPSKVAQKYCSPHCATESHRTPIPVRTCRNCGAVFRTRDHRQIFCSHACAVDTFRRSDITCGHCGKSFWPSNNKIKFCSRECARFGQTRFYGPDNHFWSGGYSSQPYYGPNWNFQRELALERDAHTCQRCETTSPDDPSSISVHHIMPFRLFGGDYEAANDLANLVALCRSCHRKEESTAVIQLSMSLDQDRGYLK